MDKCFFKIYPFKLRESHVDKSGFVSINYSINFQFVLQNHFEPTNFILGYWGTDFHVLLVCKPLVSSYIYASQWGDISTSLVVFDSLKISLLLRVINDRWCSIVLCLVIIWCPCSALSISTEVVGCSVVSLRGWFSGRFYFEKSTSKCIPLN